MSNVVFVNHPECTERVANWKVNFNIYTVKNNLSDSFITKTCERNFLSID